MASKKLVVYNDLPFNADAEKAVLGAGMLGADNLYTVLSNLKEEDFYVPKHRFIFNALVNLENKHISPDTLTMTEELINLKKLEEIGGVDYLQSCTDAVIMEEALEHYINIVKDQSCLRNVLITIRGIDEHYKNEEISDVNAFIQKCEEDFKAATDKRRVSSFSATSEIAKVVEYQIKNARPPKDDDDDCAGLTTGFKTLNRITQGFRKGELTILAARPSIGKTAFALNIGYKIAKKNIPVAIFSIEMRDDLLVKRLVSCESKVEFKKLDTGVMNSSERGAVNEALRTVANAPIFIDQTPGIQIMDLVAKSRKLKAKYPDLGLIVIDYLGLIQTQSKAKSIDNRTEEVRKISLALKGLAKDLDVPILCLSQLSRSVESRDNKRPMLSDLRDSGSIEQDADVVMFLYREDYYNKTFDKSKVAGKKGANLSANDKFEIIKAQNQEKLKEEIPGDASYVEVIVDKNRNGQTGKAGLFFFKNYQRFETPSAEWEEQFRALQDQIID